ncbi:hypothetical protein [Flagellimonas zhangzhouensis]|uniref:TonB protein C-terminal n=1 Tax=Flagellimonas zhangzhouensis TaxID=1073328 RepID=A0A1H2WNY2_9FLAO|nr:hypothetical protein [Allomuricauda zhangzhouensis]SDQ23214.1 hypothetical protein SAMN05216294_0986 [Allomuricauda zhangzhouensis]SDW82301.1 hypothetical protein SAMN04487892_2366 [Allomuricauda zhangzhouensis]
MRKLWSITFFLGLLVSCELFESKEVKTQKLVNEELLAIDWNDVDQYPLFEDCDETADKEAQRECFQNVISEYFAEALAGLEFQVRNDLHDTVYIDFLIDEHGFISVLNVEEKTSVLNEISNFNDKISARLNDLTTVAPALKRGNPVGLRFRLPLVLNTN